MNLPNKLTIFRVFLIPIFLVFFFFQESIPGGKWIALAVFIIASLTDLADGKIARKCSAMIALIEFDRIPAWVVIVIIAREFTISGFRLVAADNGRVIAASMWGKVKTTFQMVMVIVLIAKLSFSWIGYLEQFLIYASLVLIVVSLIDYLVKNKDVLSSEK